MLKKKNTFWIIAIALFIISSVSFSFALYIDKQEKENLVVSSNFIFDINYDNNLSNTDPYYVVGNQINLKVANNDGLNVFSDNITYSVSVENSEGTNITSSVVIMGNDGTLTGGVISVDNISISNLLLDTLYVVKISSTAPYTKTLSAKFMLQNSAITYYTITDFGNYIALDLYIGNIMPTSNLIIFYGLNLAPNNTNNLMEGWLGTTSGTILATSLNKNSKYTFTFFEQNTTADYTKSETELDLTSEQTITIISA